MDAALRKRRISEWLRSTRLRHFRESDGQPWSQDDLIALIHERTGWQLHRPNYSGWERGRTNPDPDTLRKLVDFWALYDEPGPDLSEPSPEEKEPSLPVVLREMVGELRALRKERQRLVDRVAALEVTVGTLSERVGSIDPAPVVPQGSTG